jgi:hypothetical protein
VSGLQVLETHWLPTQSLGTPALHTPLTQVLLTVHLLPLKQVAPSAFMVTLHMPAAGGAGVARVSPGCHTAALEVSSKSRPVLQGRS